MRKFSWILVTLVGILLISGVTQKVGGSASAEKDEEYAEDEDYTEGDDDDSPDSSAPKGIPKTTSVNSNLQVDEETKVELPCHGEHLEQFVIFWKRGDDLLASNALTTTDDKRFNISWPPGRQGGKGNSLVIHDVSGKDNGEYRCTLQLGNSNTSFTVTHTLLVREKPRVYTNPTKVVKENDSATLVCNASANPEPKVYWKRKGKNLPTGESVFEGARYTIPYLSRNHAGMYECYATNAMGTAMTAMNLHVMHAPVVQIERTSVNSGLGRKAQLVCVVLAEPKANVTWYKDGERITPPIRDPEWPAHIWKLQLDAVTKSHYGNYVCAAYNSYGRDEKIIQLSGAPSQPLLRGHKLGDDHTSYSLIWELDSASKVDGFKMRWRKVEDGAEWVEVDIADGVASESDKYTVTQTIRELGPSADYEVTLLAHNEHGWSVPAEVRSFHINGEFQSISAEEANAKDASGSTWTSSSSHLALMAALILPMVRWQ
ncbi:receptor-type tyrosine-protein phosphatase F isoform X1 [Folsomia candida]|uniref:receptor-type tyrosine-protein phosphatase F isoform X1 n=1 Tax=Folsomia candida TaxID=158441 RepID=UPI000B9081FA|nr:receptor-type tyrosine-protein phosphatase F isoform X1 [Folsomia candida]